ncbi:MAG: endopeptidase La [Bacilli bacterium]
MKKYNLPVVILKGIILLPNNDIRLEFDNNQNKSNIELSILFHDNNILLINQINTIEENMNKKQLPNIGVIAKISHKLELPNGNIRVILTALKRAKIVEYLNQTNSNQIEEAIITEMPNQIIEEKRNQILIKKLKKELEEYINEVPYISNSLLNSLEKINNLSDMTDLVVPYLELTKERNLDYLLEINIEDRIKMILHDIFTEKERYLIEKEIDLKVKEELDENQKKFLLREKIKVIKEELGESSIKDDDINLIKESIKNLKAENKIKDKLTAELYRYETISQLSPELSIIRNYIDWMISLPWNNYTIDNDDLINVRERLDSSHNGLDKVKTRIIEYLAVKQMTNSLRGPIICLVGPPGVGKTSLAYSIANAMNRKFVKMAVGGVNDEAEIIGHRRTYLGANPGRVIASLKKSKSSNPVFLIDEIDKMSKNYKGDPASVLLEILDPEQNKYFSDNYIEEEYDLSKIMFIATANYIEDIPEALKDRLEIVELSGYTEYEKIDIAKKYLLPKICKEHGVNIKGIEIKDEIILKIIKEYTKEAGVRELYRILSTIIRKIVTSIATRRIYINKYIVDKKSIIEYLGKEKYINERKLSNEIGVVNGLAYTSCGGDVLPIEVTSFKGKGDLILTGSLGEVMKESALIALNYLKSNYKYYKINYEEMINFDIHIHLPEGAIPKEGTSAGIALTTALISLFTSKKINNKLALTGEISLHGKVIEIGGLKEKSIGAYRNGIKKIIIPFGNLKDLEEIPDEIKEDIEYIPVKDYKEVFKILQKID